MLRPDTLALTILLAALTAAGPLSTDMYIPSMPDIGRGLGASVAQVQLTISCYLIGFAIGQVLYGPLSDRHGRKPVLLGAIGLFVAASAACALAPSVELLIAARVAQAIGAAGLAVLARAIVRDLYEGPRAGRELSLMGAIMAIAPVVAPIVGGVVHAAAGWRSSFAILVVLGAAAAIAVYRALPETNTRLAPERVSLVSIARSFRLFMDNRGFLAHLGMAALSYAGLFAWISASPFVLQDIHGLSPAAFGFTFAIGSLGFLAGTSLAARIVPRAGIDRTLGLGAFALAAGGVAMALAVASGCDNVATLVLPMALYLAGLGLTLPQAMAGALTPFPDHAGAASSMVGMAQQLAAALVGALVGQMLSDSARPMAYALAFTGLATLGVWAMSRRARG